MSLTIFIQSFIATFAMLCVVGPICMTVINTTIINGFRIGMFAGLGVSLADTLYVVGASFAISMLESILKSKIVTLIGICGGLFLYYIAYKFWTIKKINTDRQVIHNSCLKSFVSLFCLTLTGPTTMITYSVIFGSFLGNKNFNAISAIFGACLAIYLFYFLLVLVISKIRTKISDKTIFILNKFATIIIVCLATKLIYDGIILLVN